MRRGSTSKRVNVGKGTMRFGGLIALISPLTFVVTVGAPSSAAPSSPGYWLEAGDGGIFAYGAPFEGSAASDATRCPANPSRPLHAQWIVLVHDPHG